MESLTIESPDFDRIRDGDNRAVEDAIRLLWFVANNAEKQRRLGDRNTAARLSPKVLTKPSTTNQNNVDTEGAGLIVYTGASAIDVSGYRAPSFDGAIMYILVTGAGTITHLHQSASSDAGNRMIFDPAVSNAVSTNEGLILIYYDSRWRELNLS